MDKQARKALIRQRYLASLKPDEMSVKYNQENLMYDNFAHKQRFLTLADKRKAMPAHQDREVATLIPGVNWLIDSYNRLKTTLLGLHGRLPR